MELSPNIHTIAKNVDAFLGIICLRLENKGQRFGKKNLEAKVVAPLFGCYRIARHIPNPYSEIRMHIFKYKIVISD